MTWFLFLAAVTAQLPHGPAEAVAIADANNGRTTSGRFEMTVASTKKTTGATYLDSSSDYRAPDNLTFSIRPVVARELRRRFGAEPVDYLRGKRVVVDGEVQNLRVYSVVGGRPRDLVRYQHVVRIDHPEQIVSVE